MMKGLGDMSPEGRPEGRTDGHNGDYLLPRNFSGSIKMCILGPVFMMLRVPSIGVIVYEAWLIVYWGQFL